MDIVPITKLSVFVTGPKLLKPFSFSLFLYFCDNFPLLRSLYHSLPYSCCLSLSLLTAFRYTYLQRFIVSLLFLVLFCFFFFSTCLPFYAGAQIELSAEVT